MKYTSYLLWRFDRTFGNSRKWPMQIVDVLAALVLTIGIFTIAGCFLYKNQSVSHYPDILTITIGLIFNVTNLPQPTDPHYNLPILWQVITLFFGSVVFTGFVIAFVSNFLNNRITAYRNGLVRYHFNNHILFLGGSKMIAPMIKELYKNQSFRELHFVILTDDDPQKVRMKIEGSLSSEERNKLRITVLRGSCDDKDSLESVYLGSASRIYIIGDKFSDPEHDSKNMACWNNAKQLCSHRENVPCYLTFSHASSTFLFRHMADSTIDPNLDTTVINWPESVAQRVLVHNGNENPTFPALDRYGISKDSNRTVHFVIYGMTPISFAMATTAAHLCHFPNFVKRNADGTFGENKNMRTKITLIAPNINEEMGYLTSHLHSMFSISKYSLYDSQWKPGMAPIAMDNKEEMKRIGDFLDIEWEFVDGNIAENRIRHLLQSYYEQNQQGKTYLTIALCQWEADKNIGAALYLPSVFHDITMKEDTDEVDFEKTIPILVFQPESEEMLKTANQKITMFKNVLPFGSIREIYDPFIRRRIEEGKRIRYVYNCGCNYSGMTSDQAELDGLWRHSKHSNYFNQMSDIYSAAHIGVKLRSVGNRTNLSQDEIDLLSVTEHNRWNIERLLLGYEALPIVERSTQNTEKGLNHLKKKKESFKHYCIAPYKELRKEDKVFDTFLVKNLESIIQSQQTIDK